MTENYKRKELMRQIQAYSFTAYDLMLFLDTHPNCREAFDEFKKTLSLLAAMRKQYADSYGSLIYDDLIDRSEYDWIQRPWPWEMEA